MNAFLLMSLVHIILATFYLPLTTLCGFRVIAKWFLKKSFHLNHSFKSRAFESWTLCHYFTFIGFRESAVLFYLVLFTCRHPELDDLYSLHLCNYPGKLPSTFLPRTSELLKMSLLQSIYPSFQTCHMLGEGFGSSVSAKCTPKEWNLVIPVIIMYRMILPSSGFQLSVPQAIYPNSEHWQW